MSRRYPRPAIPPQLILFGEGDCTFALVGQEEIDWKRIIDEQEDGTRKRERFLQEHPVLL